MAFLAPLVAGAGGAAAAGGAAGAAGAGAAGAASAAPALAATAPTLGASTALPAITMPAALAPTTAGGMAAAAPSIAAPASALTSTAPVLGTGGGYAGANLGVNTSLASAPAKPSLMDQLSGNFMDELTGKTKKRPSEELRPLNSILSQQGPGQFNQALGPTQSGSLLNYLDSVRGQRS